MAWLKGTVVPIIVNKSYSIVKHTLFYLNEFMIKFQAYVIINREFIPYTISQIHRWVILSCRGYIKDFMVNVVREAFQTSIGHLVLQ